MSIKLTKRQQAILAQAEQAKVKPSLAEVLGDAVEDALEELWALICEKLRLNKRIPVNPDPEDRKLRREKENVKLAIADIVCPVRIVGSDSEDSEDEEDPSEEEDACECMEDDECSRCMDDASEEGSQDPYDMCEDDSEEQ